VADSPLLELGRRAKAASRVLANASGCATRAALEVAADLIDERAEAVLSANSGDLSRAGDDPASTPAQLDRLRLSEQRVRAMAEGMREVAALSQVVGETVDGQVRPNGLRVERVRVPLGVVGVIYENRPNVTADASALCLRSSNAVMLRGSSSAIESNKAIVSCIREALSKADLPPDGVVLVEDTSRQGAVDFMKLRGVIDCLVPRGGHSLIEAVREHATVPCVIDGDGNCHVYVDSSADIETALSIVVNAKTQRPGVCNAMESLLVHRDIAEEFLPLAETALEGVEILGDARTTELVPRATRATETDFATEFLDLKLSVAVVEDLDAAIDHIQRFSSGHSEAILTRDYHAAERFCREVDSAAVLVNASTRFVDGSELGLGAEIGISTQKLHARGPMGLRELTSVKYVIRGEGQVRT
jgi:glutamate-5-semialdehyde dehydrogenase